MVFSSYEFIFAFLPVVLLVYYLASKLKDSAGGGVHFKDLF